MVSQHQLSLAGDARRPLVDAAYGCTSIISMYMRSAIVASHHAAVFWDSRVEAVCDGR